MTWMKGFALVGVLALPLTVTVVPSASAAEGTTDTKLSTATDKPATKKPTKDQLSAYEAKCSSEADAKGLTGKKGKAEERKTFRTACIKKLIAE